jgi:hypothetical protein
MLVFSPIFHLRKKYISNTSKINSPIKKITAEAERRREIIVFSAPLRLCGDKNVLILSNFDDSIFKFFYLAISQELIFLCWIAEMTPFA